MIASLCCYALTGCELKRFLYVHLPPALDARCGGSDGVAKVLEVRAVVALANSFER